MKSKVVKNTILYFMAIILLVFGVVASVLFTDKLYAYLLALAVVLLFVVYIVGFEKKSVASRHMVLSAVLIALAVTGRFIPVLKPVTAITVIAGLYLGSGTGFLVGVMSAVVSNFYFGQGPWSLFQMLAWGLCGLLAGSISGWIKKNRFTLGLFGILTGVAYSMIMDVWTVLWTYNSFNLSMYIAALTTAMPFTLSYVLADVAYLQVLNKPLGKKLDRVKKKYL